MRLLSLFAGIGGFDLAAEWMNAIDKYGGRPWETIAQCEINPFAGKILRYYWPDAELLGDIKKTCFKKFNGKIDIITGGFPCQPYSVAGRRRGTADDRHLWPEMLRAIAEVGPRWVVGENVRGLVSWDGGLVFDQVQSDLEALGYEVGKYVLPACGVDAPHKRDRVWFVAYSSERGRGELQSGQPDVFASQRLEARDFTNTSKTVGEHALDPRNRRDGFANAYRNTTPDTASELQQGDGSGERGNEGRQTIQQEHGDADTEQPGTMGEDGHTANTSSSGWREELRQSIEQSKYFAQDVPDWQNFPTQSPLCDGDDGLSSRLDATAIFGRPCKPAHAKPFARWRNESIKGGGNAIVPQVALQIYKAIDEYEFIYGIS